jgi:hypothetical protein
MEDCHVPHRHRHVPGCADRKFREVFDRPAGMMKGIATDGRSKGAVHHQFAEDENADVIAMDEWGSIEEFESFFGPRKTSRRSWQRSV